MGWGLSIWGIHVWGGGPSSENLSFEVEDPTGSQGKPDQWVFDAHAEQEDVGTFENAVGPTWDPWGDFEELWRAPFLVHAAADLPNVLTSPVPTTWGECATLINEAVDKFQAHILTVGNIHRVKDLDNYFNYPTLTAADSAIIPALAHIMRLIFNDHMGRWPGAHTKWDLLNLIEAPQSTDLATTITLLTELRTDFNAHVQLMGYGGTTSDAIMAFAATHLSQGGFPPDLLAESYERLWDIGDMHPTPEEQAVVVTMDGPGSVTIVINAIPSDGLYYSVSDGETTIVFEFDNNGDYSPDRTQVDIAGVSTVGEVRYIMAGELSISGLDLIIDEPFSNTIILTRSDGGRVSEETFDGGTAGPYFTITFPSVPTWPVGHIEFLDMFEHLASEKGITDGLELSWLLPGSDASYPNDQFAARYISAEGFGFTESHLIVGTTENFESGWRDNETAITKYWAGNQWKFNYLAIPTQVEVGGFDDYYTYLTIPMDNVPFGAVAAPALPGSPTAYSPNLRARATVGYSASAQYNLHMFYKVIPTSTPQLDFTLPESMETGDTQKLNINQHGFGMYEITTFGATGPPSAPGTVVLEGQEKRVELFDGDWTLSLDE